MRTNWRRKPLFSWPPHPASISAVWWLLFKGNLFLDISKTHLKAIFRLRLQSLLPLWQPSPPLLWSPPRCRDYSLAVSTVLIQFWTPSVIPCRTQRPSAPQDVLFLSHYLSASLFPLLNLFFLLNYLCAPHLSQAMQRSLYHLRCSDNFIAELLVFAEDHIMAGAQLLNSRWGCSPMQMLAHHFITGKV